MTPGRGTKSSRPSRHKSSSFPGDTSRTTAHECDRLRTKGAEPLRADVAGKYLYCKRWRATLGPDSDDCRESIHTSCAAGQALPRSIRDCVRSIFDMV